MNSYPAIDIEKLKKLNKQSEQQAVQEQQTQVKQAKAKQQQQQAAKAKTKQVEEQKFNKTLVNPLKPKPKPPGQLDGLGKFIEEKIGIPVVDFLDNLSGDQNTPDQIAQERKQQRAAGQQKRQETDKALEEQAYSNPVSAVGTEVLLAGIGAVVKPVEAVIDKSYQFYLNNTVNKGLAPQTRLTNVPTQN